MNITRIQLTTTPSPNVKRITFGEHSNKKANKAENMVKFQQDLPPINKGNDLKTMKNNFVKAFNRLFDKDIEPYSPDLAHRVFLI